MKATCHKETSRTLGRYTLLELLGEGSLGPVYRAFDRDLDRHVAVRVLGDNIRWDTEVLARFLRECQAAADLRHQGIAPIHEIGQEGQFLFIATEFLGGSDLGGFIAQNSPLSVEKKLSVMIQVADGLSHAHTNGVLHRDLKPGKIHLTADGSVKIRDFGIAHVLMRHLTRPVVRWGSPIYLSPEQIQRQDPDERSDIFSAGVVFYELLTYVHPFRDQNSNKAVDKILYDTHIHGIDRFPEAPPGIWAILKTCLAKNPGDRYQSMTEVAGAFRELLKDLAEESQLMLVELQASVPRLRKVAEQPGAPENAVRLLDDIQKLLSNDENCDYASLDRLMGALAEQYSSIQAIVSVPPALEGLSPSPLPEQQVSTSSTHPDTPPPSSARVCEQGEMEAPDQPAAHAFVSDAAVLSSSDSDDVLVTREVVSAEEEVLEPGVEDFEAGLGENRAADAGSPLSPEILDATAPVPSPSAAEWGDDAVAATSAGVESPIVRIGFPDLNGAVMAYGRRIPRPAFRTAAALLSILLIVVAAYIVQSPNSPLFLRTLWSTYAPALSSTPGFSASHNLLLRSGGPSEGKGAEDLQDENQESTVRVLLAEAQTLVAQQRLEESRVLIRRILEIDPASEPAASMLKQIESRSPQTDGDGRADAMLRKGVARVSALIGSGNLITAIAELETLQQIYPRAPEVAALRRRWEARNAEKARALTRKEEERKETARLQREEDRARHVVQLFTLGKYNEAKGAVDLWITEDPTSSHARELRDQIEAVQRRLTAYESAMAGKRYQDALDALGMVEQVNPADPSLAEMRRRVESRKATASASLTVHRLGDKGILLLDGKPIGNNGEIENASVSIGSHTISVEYERVIQVSRTHEFFEGQRVVYVYDPARQLLRPIAEGDRELVAQNRAMDEVHRFEVEHNHGLFRGSCKGILLVSRFDVEYRPFSGSHGFKVPFKRINLRVDGRSLDFSYASDGKDFQGFRSYDAGTAESIRQLWEKYGALGR